MFLLCDEAGDLVRISVYNMMPALKPETSMLQRAKHANELFPVGQGIAIVEPFYKLMLDGSFGVRVDNPKDVSQVYPTACLH
jgi:hypothetical protein